MKRSRAITPAIRFSIAILQFFAKGRVEAGKDEESNGHRNENQVIHSSFWATFPFLSDPLVIITAAVSSEFICRDSQTEAQTYKKSINKEFNSRMTGMVFGQTACLPSRTSRQVRSLRWQEASVKF